MTGDELRGTGRLVRLGLRLDRVRLPIWIAGIAALVLVSAASVMGLYPDPADIAGYVALIDDNPTMVVVNGPGLGFDDPNIGVVMVNETLIWGVITVALMALFLLVRHTRTEEETERAELVRSRVVGRHAPLAAALLLVGGSVLAAGTVCLVGLLAIGFAPGGSIAFCAAVVAVGWVFAALTAVAAQVVTTARAALGLGAAAIGLSYGLRAAGDLGDNLLGWLSPLGWAHRVRPFAGERWWVLGLAVVVAAALLALAVAIEGRRDLGGGLVQQRPGRATARRTGIGVLALRLQRGSVIGWSVGLFLLGVVYGAVGRDIERIFEDNPDMEEFMEQMQGASITDSYLAYTLLLGAILTAAFAVASTLRIRGEESAGRAESLLAGAVSRTRWAGSHLAMALGGAAVVLVASGLGTGIGLAVAIDDPEQVPRLVAASLAHWPAVTVLVGAAMLLVGALPRLTALVWALVAWIVVVGLFADLLSLPEWTRRLSPLEHSPRPPADALTNPAQAVLLALAVALVAAGLGALRRRDVPSG